jgi:hypothetical protein
MPITAPQGTSEDNMIFPDYENLSEEEIFQDCYGYPKGGTGFPAALFVNPFYYCFRWWRCYIDMASTRTRAEKRWGETGADRSIPGLRRSLKGAPHSGGIEFDIWVDRDRAPLPETV